jgi:hypothetical protein
MSVMSQIHQEILELLEQGSFSPAQIAKTLDMPISWVLDVENSMEEFSEYNSENEDCITF